MIQDVRITGIGGQGILTMAKILGTALVKEGKYATMIQNFDTFISGGESTAEMRVSDQPIEYPVFEYADIGVFMAPKTYPKYINKIKKGGVAVINSDVIKDEPKGDFTVIKVPASSVARRLGNVRAANMVMLGALVARLSLADPNVVEEIIRERFGEKAELNIKAFREGLKIGRGEA